MNNKFVLTSFFLLIFFLSSVSVEGVVLDTGTNLSANNSASIYVDTVVLIVDVAQVTDNAVTLTNTSYSTTALIINHTGIINHTSGTILTSQFPRLTSLTATKGLLVSNLLHNINTSLTINVYSCSDLGDVIYDSSTFDKTFSLGSYNCTNNKVTLQNIIIDANQTVDTFTFVYNNAVVTSCRTTLSGLTQFGTFLPILIIVLVLVVVVAFLFNKGDGDQVDGLSSNAGMIVAAMVAVGIGAIIITNIAGSC